MCHEEKKVIHLGGGVALIIAIEDTFIEQRLRRVLVDEGDNTGIRICNKDTILSSDDVYQDVKDHPDLFLVLDQLFRNKFREHILVLSTTDIQTRLIDVPPVFSEQLPKYPRPPKNMKGGKFGRPPKVLQKYPKR
jgi:hypothetical protein